MLTLPDGKRVRCWRKDRSLIRMDVALTGSVMLVRDLETEVYDRVDPSSMQAQNLLPTARHVR